MEKQNFSEAPRGESIESVRPVVSGVEGGVIPGVEAIPVGPSDLPEVPVADSSVVAKPRLSVVSIPLNINDRIDGAGALWVAFEQRETIEAGPAHRAVVNLNGLKEDGQ
jgi:hypothetical protein